MEGPNGKRKGKGYLETRIIIYPIDKDAAFK